MSEDGRRATRRPDRRHHQSGSVSRRRDFGQGSYEHFRILDADPARRNDRSGLATGWEMLDDKTWRFQLRKDVFFHSGTPFNASTVKWNVETQLNPDKPGKAYAILSGLIKEVRVVDDFTVDIELIRPYAPFVTFVTTSNEAFGQRDPVKAEELGEQFGTTPSGTGPFMYKEWKLGSHVILDRNPDHWEGAPCVDALEFKIMPEASTRYAALRSGGDRTHDRSAVRTDCRT